MICTLYVLKMKTPGKWYVGTTTRLKYIRFNEHRRRYACRWTQRHGFGRIFCSYEVPVAEASRLENDVWMHLARLYGPSNVRGGDVTIVQPGTDDILPYLLPVEFGGTRIVDWGLPQGPVLVGPNPSTKKTSSILPISIKV